MRILITGATGFVGHPLLQRLSVSGDHQILALTRTKPSSHIPNVEWLVAVLMNPESYYENIQDFVPQAVVHLAWQDIPDYSLPKSLENLRQSIELLDCAMQSGECQKVLIAGSCFELNKLMGECSEEENGSAKDHFTWAKHSLRDWIEMETLKRGIVLGWLRIFYVYGPRQRQASLLPSILQHLKKGELPLIKTPQNANDFVYVDDVVEGFVNAIKKAIPSGVYNLGSGASTSVLELCRKAERVVLGSSGITEVLERREVLPPQDVNFWANIQRSREILGWEPQTSLESGIAQTWEWMQLQ